MTAPNTLRSKDHAAHLGRGRRRPRGHSCLAWARIPDRDWGKKRGPTHSAANADPTPSRRTRLRLSDTSPGERGGEVPEPGVGLPLPLPHIKGSPRPGHRPLATPSPTRRMMGAAPRTPAKPEGGAAWSRVLGITASWGLRILRPQAHPRFWPASPAPAADSVLSNSNERRGGPSGLRRTGAGQWPQRRGRAGSAPAHVEPGSGNPGVAASARTTLPRGPRACAFRVGLGGRSASFAAQPWGAL